MSRKLVKVLRLPEKAPYTCFACGAKAVIAVRTQTEWEFKRDKHTICFYLCGNHGLQFADMTAAQCLEPVAEEKAACPSILY